MLRTTLSLTFLALGHAFSNTPYTGCNDAAPEVVEALAAEQGYAPHMVKSCGDIMALGGCSTLKTNGYKWLQTRVRRGLQRHNSYYLGSTLTKV